MADSFFGFNTSLSGYLDEELPDGPGPELEDEEEEYDALNDETFGADALAEGDWEEDHEKLAELAEQSRLSIPGSEGATTGPTSSTPRHNQPVSRTQSLPHSDSSEDFDLEARVAHLMLEEEDEGDLGTDDVVLENGDLDATESHRRNNHLENVANFPKVADLGAFNNMSPSSFSMWGVGKLDVLTFQTAATPASPKPLPGVKSVCTVEELERGLIQQSAVSSASTQPPPPAAVLRVEDIERELTMSSGRSNSSGSSAGHSSVTTAAPAAGPVVQPTSPPQVPQFPPPPIAVQPQEAIRGTQASLGRGISFPPPVLGLTRGATHPNGPFVVPPPRVVAPPPSQHPAGIHPVLLHQANHRLGSNPSLLRFIPPHLMGHPGAVGKNLQQVFPGDNGLLRNVPHRGPNVQFRPGFPMGDHMWQQQQNQHLQQQNHPHHPMHHHPLHIQQQQLQQQRLRAVGKTVNHRPHYNQQQQNGVVDEYAGLMSHRERQWLIGIQMLQLNTNTPHIDDYYYTVFMSRQLKNEQNGGGLLSAAQQHHHQQMQRQRERRDSQRSEGGQSSLQQSRVYTPAQFENSLGKLQVGSVTAPRKIIDMDIMNTDTIDTILPPQQKDLRKTKQLLLEIERLYMLLLQVEDLKSDIPEIREEVTENRDDLLRKIVSAVLLDDRLASILCVRKGRKLILRLLPQLPVDSSSLAQLWGRVVRGLSSPPRRDVEALYPYFHQWLEAQAEMLPLINIIRSPPRSFSITNKFALSVYGALLERAEQLSSAAESVQLEEWASFVQRLGAAAAAVPSSPLPDVLQPLDGTLAASNLRRYCPPCSGCEWLTRAFGPRDSSVSR